MVIGVVIWIFSLINDARSGWYGLPLLVAPGIAVAIGVLVFALLSARIVSYRGPRRSASLMPRTAWCYGPAWGFLLPLIAAGAVIAFAIAAGLASSQQPDGAFRSIRIGTSVTGPYPGWYYGVPLIAVTVLLAGVTVFALGHIASAPRSAADNDPIDELDRIVRILSTRTVMQLSSGALFLYSGCVSMVAGWATSNAATTFASGSRVLQHRQPATAIGVTEISVGVAFALLGGVLLTLSILDAAQQPLRRVARSRVLSESVTS